MTTWAPAEFFFQGALFC